MIETVAARSLTSPRRDSWLTKTTSPLVHLSYGREKPKEFPEFPILDRVCVFICCNVSDISTNLVSFLLISAVFSH